MHVDMSPLAVPPLTTLWVPGRLLGSCLFFCVFCVSKHTDNHVNPAGEAKQDQHWTVHVCFWHIPTTNKASVNVQVSSFRFVSF
jgi:hypothetical protein